MLKNSNAKKPFWRQLLIIILIAFLYLGLLASPAWASCNDKIFVISGGKLTSDIIFCYNIIRAFGEEIIATQIFKWIVLAFIIVILAIINIILIRRLLHGKPDYNSSIPVEQHLLKSHYWSYVRRQCIEARKYERGW